MANFVTIVNQDIEKRQRFMKAVKGDLLPYEWLRHEMYSVGNADLALGAIPEAPRSMAEGYDGSKMFLIGSLYRERLTEDSDASFLMDQYLSKGWEKISGHSGYYAATVIEKSGRITVATDILGLFPIYYYSSPNTLIFGTSPAFVRRLPDFSTQLDINGLIGILLTMHLVGGKTLLRGVRRLAHGTCLRWTPGEGAREETAEVRVPSCARFGDTYEEALTTFDELLRNVVIRETRNKSVSILLSGGLDSRLLGGYLQTAKGTDVSAVTFGSVSDYEMKFANRVAKVQRWSQSNIEIDYSGFKESALRVVDQEMLSNGFNDLSFLQGIEQLRRISPYIVTGFAGDIVVGGSHLRDHYARHKDDHCFESKFKSINMWGLSPQTLRTLLRRDLVANSIEEVMGELEQSYMAIEGLPFHRTWMFDMLNRVRFHVCATIGQRISFGSWPIMPYIDKTIMETAFSLPAAVLHGRRVQVDLLCRYYPELASIPLDRNSFDTAPLLSKWHNRLIERALSFVHSSKIEQRYYVRVFDINNKGWTDVREEANNYRNRVSDLIDMNELGKILPSPSAAINLTNPIADASGLKLLIGFMLWAGRFM